MTVIKVLVTQVKDQIAILKRCYDEAEACNDELAELLRQSLARERELQAIIIGMINGTGREL